MSDLIYRKPISKLTKKISPRNDLSPDNLKDYDLKKQLLQQRQQMSHKNYKKLAPQVQQSQFQSPQQSQYQQSSNGYNILADQQQKRQLITNTKLSQSVSLPSIATIRQIKQSQNNGESYNQINSHRKQQKDQMKDIINYSGLNQQSSHQTLQKFIPKWAESTIKLGMTSTGFSTFQEDQDLYTQNIKFDTNALDSHREKQNQNKRDRSPSNNNQNLKSQVKQSQPQNLRKLQNSKNRYDPGDWWSKQQPAFDYHNQQTEKNIILGGGDQYEESTQKRIQDANSHSQINLNYGGKSIKKSLRYQEYNDQVDQSPQKQYNINQYSINQGPSMVQRYGININEAMNGLQIDQIHGSRLPPILKNRYYKQNASGNNSLFVDLN
eukprot:403349523